MAAAAVFQIGNAIALTGWIALTFAVFSSRARTWGLRYAGLALPALLGVAYIGLMAAGRDAFENGGGFSSIDAVRKLFDNDFALTAGWLHYLAFDLFVGAYIVREGRAAGWPGWLCVLLLPPTLMFGPLGLLLYFALRLMLRGEAGAGPTPLSALYRRQPMLAIFGAALLALALGLLVLQVLDPRQLDGQGVWVKPTKFAVSIAVFAWTAAWFLGCVRPERRASAPMRWVAWSIVLMGGFELAYITLQAGLQQQSHFNNGSPFHTAMYAAMGVGAVIMVSSTLPLAWEIWRRPIEGLRGDYRAAVVLGLVLTFVLGGGLGGYMGASLGHAVGPEGGRFPVFGWNREGGDLRVAHFFGMHMEQALPMLSALLAGLPALVRWSALAIGAVAGAGLTIAVFVQALAAQPFAPAF